MQTEFARRLESRETELNTLFFSLYPDRQESLSELLQMLRDSYASRG